MLVPLADGPFEGLGLTERAIFGAIWGRYRVSCYTQLGSAGDCPYMDDDGQVYCFWRQDDLAAVVGVSDRTLRRALDNLRSAGLIRTRKAGYGGACKYYVTYEARAWLKTKKQDNLTAL